MQQKKLRVLQTLMKMITMSESIYNTGTYTVKVLPYKKSEVDENTFVTCYGIVNNKTGVVEFWELVLPNAINLADDFTNTLNNLWNSKVPNDPPVIN